MSSSKPPSTASTFHSFGEESRHATLRTQFPVPHRWKSFSGNSRRKEFGLSEIGSSVWARCLVELVTVQSACRIQAWWQGWTRWRGWSWPPYQPCPHRVPRQFTSRVIRWSCPQPGNLMWKLSKLWQGRVLAKFGFSQKQSRVKLTYAVRFSDNSLPGSGHQLSQMDHSEG